MQAKTSTARRLAHKGFTLIELAIVIVIIGALIAIIAPKLKGGGTEAKATAMYDFASSAVNNWRLVNMKCGTSTDSTGTPLVTTQTAAATLNFIVTGSGAAATYAGCVSDAQLANLRAKVQGTSGAYTVQNYTTTWTGGASGGAVSIVFANVPTDVLLSLYKKYSSVSGASSATTASLSATGDATDPMVQYGAITAGIAATVTILI